MFTSETHLRDIHWLSVDLETMGLAPSIDPILEMGLVAFRRSGRTTKTFSTLCDPKTAIPRRITELTGITQDMVDGQPSPDVAIETLAKWLAEEPSIIIAHGVSTDLAFIRENARRLGLPLPPMVAVDTLPLARLCISESKDYTLSTLASGIQESVEGVQFHRALDDALQTKKLFLHCLSNSPRPLATLGDLEKARVMVKEPHHLPVPRPIPTRFDELIPLVRQEKTLEIQYRGGALKGIWRAILPQTFFQRSGHHYLRAWSIKDDVTKDFRLDRIARYRVQEE